VIPAVLGAVLSWYQGNPFKWFEFVMCVLGAWFAHLGANAANDCFDDVSGVDRIAHESIPENRGSTVCGSEVLTRGLMTRRQGFVATAVFFLIAGAFGLPLVAEYGWPIALLAGCGFLIGIFYCAAPIRFGYIGRGLGELGVFIAFGPLPVLGSYYVQTGFFSWSALMASIAPGLFTVSILYNHHFSHATADERAGKVSPVVALGHSRARIISPVLLAASYVALIASVALGVLPEISLVALITAVPIFLAYARLPKEERCSDSLGFLFKVVKTNVATGALLIGSIFLSSLW